MVTPITFRGLWFLDMRTAHIRRYGMIIKLLKNPQMYGKTVYIFTSLKIRTRDRVINTK